MRVPAQLPGNGLSIRAQIAPASSLRNSVIGNPAIEGKCFPRAQLQFVNCKSLNEAAGLAFARKPCGPNLRWHRGGRSAPTAASQIHHQIAEPPCPASIGEPAPQKPNLIAALHSTRRIHRIQLLLIQFPPVDRQPPASLCR